MIADAAIITAMLQGECSASVIASTTIEAAAAAAIIRIGRSRRPIQSDHRPAAIRPSAPNTWATITSTPADSGVQPR